jgi:hypothetical protein
MRYGAVAVAALLVGAALALGVRSLVVASPLPAANSVGLPVECVTHAGAQGVVFDCWQGGSRVEEPHLGQGCVTEKAGALGSWTSLGFDVYVCD